MKKTYGIVGNKGKIGSSLLRRADFVPIECDVTDIDSIYESAYSIWGEEADWGVIVNCAAISSIDQCEADYQKAINVNVHGLSNLHRVFGERVLNISSDHIFNGRGWMLPKEDSTPSPINNYGLTKFASEGVSNAFGGKTIRLSRTVDIEDGDMQFYLQTLEANTPIEVPDFFSRNYIHREYAVSGIEYMARNWNSMPSIVNYAGTDNVTMFSFVKMIAMEVGLDYHNVTKKRKYDDTLTPRPRKGGFNVSLAKSLGFPMYSISDTVSKFAEAYGG